MNKHICRCGKEFDNGRSLQSHMRTCKIYKKWRQQTDLLKQIEREKKRLPNGLFKCENPKCGKEHDGSYGSGRFCSKSCRLSYIAQQNNFVEIGNKHRSRRQLNLEEQHLKARAPYGTWTCKQCNIVFNTRQELFQHNHEAHPIQYKLSWNKGHTKNDDNRIAIGAKHVSESFKAKIINGYKNPTWTGEYWTDEKRKERSLIKKKFYLDHPEKHPNRAVAGNRKKMTYPEQVAFDWLTKRGFIFECQKEFILDGHKRFVDFYLPQQKLFIEIDGEFWHPEGNANDKEKDEIALKHGYKTLRIRPKNIVVNQLETFFN